MLGDALQEALDDPEVQAKLRGLGTEGRKMIPEQYDALLKKEGAAAAQMIKDGLLKFWSCGLSYMDELLACEPKAS